MSHKKFIIKEKLQEVANTTIFRVQPAGEEQFFSFSAGQHCKIINPKYSTKDARCFSIASCPSNKNYFEFAIKTYGNWTQAISQLEVGDELHIAGPFGQFTWDNTLSHIILLVGGLGIAPLMSMLRYAKNHNVSTHITLIYGNTLPETIVFKKELEDLEKQTPNLHVVHVLSRVEKERSWKGHRGFISEEIIKKEVNLETNPTFFVIGPQPFMDNMQSILKKLNIQPHYIRQEILV